MSKFPFRGVLCGASCLSLFSLDVSASDGSGLVSLTEARNNEYSISTSAGSVSVNCVTDMPSNHAVSHDGKRRIFVHRCASAAGNVVETYLLIQDQARTKSKRISMPVAGALQLEATLSDDGNWVAYTIWTPTSGDYAVHLTHLTDWTDDDSSSAVAADTAIDTPLRGGHVIRARRPFVSADGQYVVFDASSTDSTQLSQEPNIYLYDAATKSLRQITAGTNGANSQASISVDGKRIAFVSSASDLIASDSNGWDDVYVWDSRAPLASPRFLRASQASSTPSGGADAPSGDPSISANGNFVVYSSYANDLADEYSGALNVKSNVYLFDVAGNESYLVNSPESTECKDTPAKQTTLGAWPICFFNGGPESSWNPTISADGRYIAFVSEIRDLIPTWSDAFGEWLPGETTPSGWQPDIQPKVLLRDMQEGKFYLQSSRAIYEDAVTRTVPGWYNATHSFAACMDLTSKPFLGLSLSADGMSTMFQVSDQASHCAEQSTSFSTFWKPDPDTSWSIFLRQGKGVRSNKDPYP